MRCSCTNAQRKTLTVYTCCERRSGKCGVTCTFLRRPFCAAEGCARCCGCGRSTAVTKMPHSCCGPPSGGFGRSASHACKQKSHIFLNKKGLLDDYFYKSHKNRRCRRCCYPNPPNTTST